MGEMQNFEYLVYYQVRNIVYNKETVPQKRLVALQKPFHFIMCKMLRKSHFYL